MSLMCRGEGTVENLGKIYWSTPRGDKSSFVPLMETSNRYSLIPRCTKSIKVVFSKWCLDLELKVLRVQS